VSPFLSKRFNIFQWFGRDKLNVKTFGPIIFQSKI
jgi:hypothetical protein